MCINIYTWHLGCDCCYYQNTWQCHYARRCNASDSLTLPATVALPAPPPKVPPGLLPCTVKQATRPQRGNCPACIRMKGGKGTKKVKKDGDADADGHVREEDGINKKKSREKGKKHVSVTRVRGVPVLSLGDDSFTDTFGSVRDDDDDAESPDGKAVARLRDSFMQLAEEHDPSRSSPKK